MNDVKDSGIHGFWVTIGIFLILAVVHLTRYMLDMYLMQRFIMRWRIWLSGRLIDDWLGDFAYYRRQFFHRPNDNPDQRIQQDIDIFTTLDEGLELTLYEPIRAELPDTILVSVSHRSTVEQFHGRQLELVGGGEWRLDPLTTSS